MSRSPTIRSAALSAGLKRRLYRAVRDVRHPGPALERRRIRDEVAGFLGGRDVLAAYEREVRGSGLMEHLLAKGREHHEAVAASGHSLGAIGYAEGAYLYALLRSERPDVVVETGVANGFSTAFSLLALQANGIGHLHSIDLPREVGREYEAGTFFEGEGRAGIPPGSEPGWLIPPPLKERWTLILGRSQEELPPLLERLGDGGHVHARQRALVRLHVVRVQCRVARSAGGRRTGFGRRELDGGLRSLCRAGEARTRAARPGDGPAAEVI